MGQLKPPAEKPAAESSHGIPVQPYYELPPQLRTAILNYLGERPHREVDPAIIALRNLKLCAPLQPDRVFKPPKAKK